MIACYAWTNTQIINVTNARINLYGDEKADLYIFMGKHMSKELIAAVNKTGVYEHVFYIEPFNLDYKKLKFGKYRGLRLLYLKKEMQKVYAALLDKMCKDVRYDRALLAWFYQDNLFVLDYWAKFTDHLAITLVDEGTGSYCYTKEQISFPMFMANSLKDKIKRHLTDGSLAKRFAKNIDTFCLYRPEYARPDIDFTMKQLPIITKESNPIMYQMLLDATVELEQYGKQVRYNKRDMIYFSQYSPEGKSFDMRSLNILHSVISHATPAKTIAKIHMGNTNHAENFAKSLENKIYVDRDRYIFEGLYLQMEKRSSKVFISCASSAALYPKFMFGEEPYVIFTYRLYDTYRQMGVERDDWIANALKSSYSDPSRVYIPNSMQELDDVLKQIVRQRYIPHIPPKEETVCEGCEE